MRKTRTMTSKKHFFNKLSIFLLVPLESPEGPLEVPDVRTFKGPSVDVPRTSRAGWDICTLIVTVKKVHAQSKQSNN